MREILFRGRPIDGSYWVEGTLFILKRYQTDIEHYYILPANTVCLFCDIPYIAEEVDPSTVDQYTGLTDKNGKKAFSHDISIDSQGRKWVIFTCPGGFRTCRTVEWELMCNGILTPANVGLSDIQNAEWFENCHEVIGNVVDNPELLEDGE